MLIADGETEPKPDLLAIPFAFYNDTIGFAIGGTVGARGIGQPQATLRGTVTAADSGTYFLFLAGEDYRAPKTERFFLDAGFALGTFSEIDSYTDGNPDFPDEKAGSNDSDPDNFIQSEGEDNSAILRLSYLLPIGYGREHTTTLIVLSDGLLADGAGRTSIFWTPWRTGLTTLSLDGFYRTQDLETDDRGDGDLTTGGITLALRYDNTDFSLNPTKGSVHRFGFRRDPGALGSSTSWSTWEYDWRKYISLGTARHARQRVLAFNFWIIDTPTWDDDEPDGGHRPPPYAGASLGGIQRMRGYPQGRFNGRSALFYAAEYRHTPDWNPLRSWRLLEKVNVNVDWLQFAAFAEWGRVAEEFDLSELHSDLQFCWGGGLRGFVNQMIVRVDFAVSDEDALLQMAVDHPF